MVVNGANDDAKEIRVERLTKSYRGRAGQRITALEGLDLVVSRGESLAVVGPSGSGKTTLLRLVAGLEEPTSGQVRYGNRAVTAIRPEQRRIHFLFQDAPLYPSLTVEKNLATAYRAGRGSAEDRQTRIEGIAERFKIRHRLKSMPEQLSRGERQRVALGRALLSRPGVLLLDEPLSNLDPETRYRLRLEIANLRREISATMVHVTHDPFEAFTLGDRVAVLNEGKLSQIDRPESVYRAPADRFVAGFVGFPPMNFLEGEIEETNGNKRLVVRNGERVVARFQPPSEGTGVTVKRLVVGIRPEQVRVSRSPEALPWQEAVIRRIERFGPNEYWQVELSGETLVVKGDPAWRVSLVDRIGVHLKDSSLTWFAADSGKRLG